MTVPTSLAGVYSKIKYIPDVNVGNAHYLYPHLGFFFCSWAIFLKKEFLSLFPSPLHISRWGGSTHFFYFSPCHTLSCLFHVSASLYRRLVGTSLCLAYNRIQSTYLVLYNWPAGVPRCNNNNPILERKDLSLYTDCSFASVFRQKGTQNNSHHFYRQLFAYNYSTQLRNIDENDSLF